MRNFVLCLLLIGSLGFGGPGRAGKTVWIADEGGRLRLRLNTDGRALLDAVVVNGREVIGRGGVCSAVKMGGRWHTTRRGIPSPTVAVSPGSVVVTGIRFGGSGLNVDETWTFTPTAGSIRWRIERRYDRAAVLDDVYFPGWHFASMQTWTGALLDTGGVAWGKLLRRANASYAAHAGTVTFWNAETNDALRIAAAPSGVQAAVRFTRQPGGAFSLNHTIAPVEMRTAHELRRFLSNRQDVWAPFRAEAGTVTVEYTLSALRYDQVSDPGDLKGIDAGAVREISNTIGRIGVIDRGLVGSNGWYSGYVCLHEPWFALMGLPLQDPNYFNNLADALDNYRDHAVTAEGRVKGRWAYNSGDAMPGTYDANGFYEAQWGILFDSQPSYVSNVAELFEITGDRDWAAGQQAVCRRVLDYALARDRNGNGLIEVMTDSHADARGSDWIDVIWAAYENGLVNAEMFNALRSWARVEDALGDPAAAARYRAAATRIQAAFNRPLAEGGLWDPENGCYAYWRDRDGSVHGRNFVVPVNLLAVGSGLCDDPARVKLILDRLEERMTTEGLFFWPLCLDSYQREEVYARVNWPFPNYENGDIFLAWGEVGVRAYARYRPEIALKYVRNVLARYRRDGLAYQRYLRRLQTGIGGDILANNMLTVAGLYRDIYGIQPRHDGLYIDPHLPAELVGTRLTYTLRGKEYTLTFNSGSVKVESGKSEFTAVPPFLIRDED